MKNKFGFLLIKPQLGENIGACARSMKNFGFDKLNIVSPKFTFPNHKTKVTSVGAYDIIYKAKIYDEIDEAINKFDIIISSGGSSFSSKDYISSFLSQNTELLFKYVRIQPGRPVIFSKLKFNYYFSLPGNPLAVFTNLFFLVSLFIDPSRKDNSSITKFYQSGFSEA